MYLVHRHAQCRESLMLRPLPKVHKLEVNAAIGELGHQIESLIFGASRGGLAENMYDAGHRQP
jgi:hypothetical protein